jgi:hypothetical protein
MPVSSGPNTVNDSIIFNYDIRDVANSYKGEPTTNQVTNASTFGGGWAPYSNGNDGTFITEFGTTGYQILNKGSWNGIYQNFNLGSAGTYTFSAWFKYLGGSSNNNGSTVYISNYGGGDTAAGLNKSLVGVWQRVSHTVNVTSPGNVYFYIISYGGTYGADNSSWQVTMPQAEQKSYATPFVNNTRSTTEGLLDLSGNGNSIDVSNASFTSNGQMTFDGTNDYIDVTTSLGTLSQYTIEHVSFYQTPDRMPIAFRGGPVFYQYGDNSWYYTHGGVAGEYYYPRSFTMSGWGHWTIVYNGSFVRIYRNGRYEGQQATSGTANWNSGMRIGYWPYGGGYAWNGQIAVVKMYNRALSDNEVVNNYNEYKTRFNLQ